MQTKQGQVCSDCKAEKPLDAFWLNKRLKDGRYAHCKDCGKTKEQTRRKATTIKEYKPGTYIFKD